MRARRSRARTAVAAAATLPLVAGALALGIQGADADTGDGGRHVLKGTKPQWATEKADRGSTAGSGTVNARVYLAGRDAKGLADYAAEVSDPGSAEYGHYLTARQAEARFGATAQQKAKVADWLTSAGLTVTATTRHYVAVRGSVSAAEKAFATQLRDYKRGSKTYHAPAKAASAPADVGDAVLTVTGLNNAPHKVKQDAQPLPPPPVFKNSGPFSSFYGSNVNTDLPEAYGAHQPYAVKGYTGRQLRAAYGAGKWTGRGVRVAITDAYASPTLVSDTARYVKNTDGRPYRRGQLKQVLPKSFQKQKECDAPGWQSEIALDVESVHAVAPDAGITYVGGASCFDDDLLTALNKIVDHRLADIVSNSWGDIEANQTPDLAAAYDQVFQMGAVEGIGFYFSSGDSGDNVASTGTKQVDVPANSAWVTSVGGTSLAVGRHNSYRFETGWGTLRAALSDDGKSWADFPGPFTSGAGGGTSRTVPQPAYQRGVVPDSLATANGGAAMRTEPDIGAVADPNTGFLVGHTQLFPDGSEKYSQYRLGGTSLASPVIAAVQALAQQARGGMPIGFANPAIYARAGAHGVYHDVTDHPLGADTDLAVVRVDFNNSVDASEGTTTSIRTLGKDSSLVATKGYDVVTGVGSPARGYIGSYRR